MRRKLRKPSINECKCKEILDNKIDAIMRSERQKNKPEPVKGIRQCVLEVYYSEGILAALEELKRRNAKFGKEIYTREIFENWIAEEARKRGNDDGFDR